MTEDKDLREAVKTLAQEWAAQADDPDVDTMARHAWWEASKELQEVLDEYD